MPRAPGPQIHCPGDLGRAGCRSALPVRQRPGDAQHPVIPTQAQLPMIEGAIEAGGCCPRQSKRPTTQQVTGHVTIEGDSDVGPALRLCAARLRDPLRHGLQLSAPISATAPAATCGTFTRRSIRSSSGPGDGRHTDAGPSVSTCGLAAGKGVPARTRVGRHHEEEARRIGHRFAGACDGDHPDSNGCRRHCRTEDLNSGASSREQHTAMSPRHRAGDHRRAAAADDRRRARRVMRCLEGRRQVEATRLADTGQERIACDSNASARGELRQGRRRAARRASSCRRRAAREEQVVPADRRELDNSRASLLADDVGKVPTRRSGADAGECRRDRQGASSVRSRHTPRRVRPGWRRHERSPFDKASLGDTRGRHDDMAHTRGCGCHHHGKDPNRPDRAVQTQLPKCTDRAATDASITSAAASTATAMARS